MVLTGKRAQRTGFLRPMVSILVQVGHRLDPPLLAIMQCSPVSVRDDFREQFGVVDPKAAG